MSAQEVSLIVKLLTHQALVLNVILDIILTPQLTHAVHALFLDVENVTPLLAPVAPAATMVMEVLVLHVIQVV